MKKLINIKGLNKDKIYKLFLKADSIADNSKKKNRKILRGKTIVNLFFENSTRTLVSFDLAAKRLGADVININLGHSSTKKGESLKDTILTLQAMKVDAFIVRHSQNHICEEIQQWLSPKTVLINAGDGNNQHPTQALLDIYTILQYHDNIENLKISIIGDIKHSRVANSLIDALTILENKQIHLFGPKEMLPIESKNTIICDDIDQALHQCDVVVMLRIQIERMTANNIPDLENYHQQFALSRVSLKSAKPSCIIMHPGPINRGVEISNEIADNSPSVILQQVKNGVLIRQAVLAKLLNH